MSTLQKQAIGLLDGLSDDNLEFLINLITKFMIPESTEKIEMKSGSKYKIGIFKGKKWCAPDYDLDEDNEEIEKLFEGLE